MSDPRTQAPRIREMRSLRDYIRTIPDFPKPGIMFRDVTTLFADARGFRMAVDRLLTPMPACPSTRWWVWRRGASSWAARWHIRLSVGFVPIRKRGKLPGAVIAEAYALEYGEAVVEIHDDALKPGDRVLIVDDLLATGGTAAAGIRLCERLNAEVIGCAFVIDLPDLGGRALLEGLGHDVHALTAFAGD